MWEKKNLEEHMLTLREKRLMEVLFQGGATEEDIRMFTEGLDVDTESSDYMLMLSYLGYAIQWRWFPEEIIPRIQGLYRYYQVRNAMGIKGMLTKVDLLAKAGIPVMLIKGMAMRYHYAAGVPRIMSDMDLLVPEERFEDAVRILCATGGTEAGYSAWSVHIENGIASIDLHRWLFKHHGEKGENIWERAVPIDFYGRKMYVPSPEDMFVHQLDTRARAIFVFEAETRRMRWLYDCRNICGEGAFDWELAMERIRAFHIENTSYFMLKAFSDCFPSLLSDKFIEEKVTPLPQYTEWVKRGMKCREIMKEFPKVEKERNLWKYTRLWLKMKYYDYRKKNLEAKIMDGKRLSPVQYLKQMYLTESLRESLQILAQSVKRRVSVCKKGDGADARGKTVV